MTYFRKNQLQLVSGLLVLLLGGWLSFFCQHCQAYAAVSEKTPEQQTQDHCKHSPPVKDSTDEQALHEDCLGNCDQDNNDIFAADSLQTISEKLSYVYQPDVFTYHKRYIPVPSSHSLVSLNGRSLVFERACFLPLDRFCVQLK